MLRFAFRNLVSRPARSLLSLLGLTVAIAGMVGLFSVAEGIDAMVGETFGRFPGLLVMQKGAPIPLFSRVPKAWAKEIEELPGINAVSAEIWVRVNRVNDKDIVSPPRFLFGADIPAHYRLKYSVYKDAIYKGRYLDDSDADKARTVISRQIADEFEVDVGDSFVVNGVSFEIVGLYHCGSLLLDVAIIADQSLVRRMSLFDPSIVCSFYVEPTGEIGNDELVEWMQELFHDRDLSTWQPSSIFGQATSEESSAPTISGPTGNPIIDWVRKTDRRIKSLTHPELVEAEEPVTDTDDDVAEPEASGESLKDGPLEIRSAADWADRFDEFSEDLDIFLAVITSIGLTIAILSVINTMLMSVSERIIEFGILKANGWSRSDVMRLITFESAMLGFAGGVAGSLCGWAGTLLINWNYPDRVSLYASPGLLLFSLVFATLLGVVGGLYPAVWATRMMPMDAIRRG